MNNQPASSPRESAPAPLLLPDAMLQAYVDGHLDEGQRALVQTWLAEHPERAAQADDFARINDALHTRYDAVLDEPVPARLSALLDTAAPALGQRAGARAWLARLFSAWPAISSLPSAWPAWRPASFAVAAAWMVLGGAAGWQAHSLAPDSGMPPMVRHAAVAYVTYASEVVHPVEVEAGREAHLVAWLSKRLGMNLKAAKLDALGYTLMGGRLIPGTQRPVAQFMYEDAIGRRLTLYIKTQESEHDQSAAFRFAREAEVSAFYWIDNGTGYVLSGAVARDDLLKVALAVHAQLNAAPANPPAALAGGKSTRLY